MKALCNFSSFTNSSWTVLLLSSRVGGPGKRYEEGNLNERKLFSTALFKIGVEIRFGG